MRRTLVVVGASAGGVDALRTLVAGLPIGFPAATCIVLHTASDSPGMLEAILEHAGVLPVIVVQESELLMPGRIYLAPPDKDLLVSPSRVRAVRGPRERRFRPAIDPLFCSAAGAYGARTIGVILTGDLDDGSAGLRAVKQMGGITIVQDPAGAFAPSMPRSALASVNVDYCLGVRAMPRLLRRLAWEDISGLARLRARRSPPRSRTPTIR